MVSQRQVVNAYAHWHAYSYLNINIYLIILNINIFVLTNRAQKIKNFSHIFQ